MATKTHRKVIAVITAAALAITGIGATPLQANGYNSERALAALLGLAVIGAIVANERKDRKNLEPQVQRQALPHVQQHILKPSHIAPRPLPQRARLAPLPGQCLRFLDNTHGPNRVFGARCLQRNYQAAQWLPRNCLRQFQTNRGWREGYGARCLRHEGYEIANY